MSHIYYLLLFSQRWHCQCVYILLLLGVGPVCVFVCTYIAVIVRTKQVFNADALKVVQMLLDTTCFVQLKSNWKWIAVHPAVSHLMTRLVVALAFFSLTAVKEARGCWLSADSALSLVLALTTLLFCCFLKWNVYSWLMMFYVLVVAPRQLLLALQVLKRVFLSPLLAEENFSLSDVLSSGALLLRCCYVTVCAAVIRQLTLVNLTETDRVVAAHGDQAEKFKHT